MEGPEIKAVEAVIDNGSFGKRTLRFETGRLAQQADGAVAAYLDDDSMILSTTTAGSSPKENYDFFPLTVDVEEKMYAAGKIPGSFFRREGRPSSEAILACRIIDRPLRPLFPHTLRNEVQVVETVLAVNPDDAYDGPDRRPVGRLPALERARTRRVRNRGRRPRCRERRRRHRHDRSRCRQERMAPHLRRRPDQAGRGSRRRRS